MCISDNTRRRSLLASSDTASLLIESVFDESPQAGLDGDNYNLTNQRPYKRMTYSSIIPKPTTVAMANALKVEETAETHPNKQHCVQHNYHDHASDLEGMYQRKPAVSKGGVSVPFPMKLHDMLEYIESEEPELASIVSWQPHGRCFLVHNSKEFAQHVLPRFFQQKKYASFQRQLNLYGFSRITRQGADRGSYYHEFFLRGKKFLCSGINRMKVKGTGARMASNPDAEPDFYAMTPIVSNPIEISRSSTIMCPSDHSNSSSASTSTCESESNFAPLTVPSTVMNTSIVSSFPSLANNNDASLNRMQVQNYHPYPSTNTHPMLPTSSAFNNENGISSDLVFENMAFHSLDADVEDTKFRRHSLMDPRSRRSSVLKSIALQQPAHRRGSVEMDDMDTVLNMFNSDDLTEEEMTLILNDIIAL